MVLLTNFRLWLLIEVPRFNRFFDSLCDSLEFSTMDLKLSSSLVICCRGSKKYDIDGLNIESETPSCTPQLDKCSVVSNILGTTIFAGLVTSWDNSTAPTRLSSHVLMHSKPMKPHSSDISRVLIKSASTNMVFSIEMSSKAHLTSAACSTSSITRRWCNRG